MDKLEYKKMYDQENNFFWYKTLHNLIISHIEKLRIKDAVIFDAGFGTGRLLELLENFGDVSGIDYSEEAIYFSKLRGIKNIKQENLNNWEEPKNKYDIITSIDVLYHSAIKSDADILLKFYNSLKPGGILILNLAAFDILKRKHDEYVYTKRRYRIKPLTKKMKNIGFKIKKASYRMPILFFIILIQKLVIKISNVKEQKSDMKEISPVINKIFTFLGAIENYYLLKVGYIPFGSSVFVIAKK